MLPVSMGEDFLGIWQEFEEGTTADARLAEAVDRLQPLLVNVLAEGGTWTENDVTEAQVHERYGRVIRRASEELWGFVRAMVRSYFAASRPI
jgi:putative hydrolases of HD superfamily